MAKTKFDKATLTHIAKLARINLSPSEVDTYQQQIDKVIEHINRLKKVDTSDIKPTFQVTDTKNVFNNATQKHLPVKSVLYTSKKTHQDFIVVPASIEK